MGKEKTVVQRFADWLALDGGKRDTRFEVTYSKKVFVIKRIKK